MTAPRQRRVDSHPDPSPIASSATAPPDWRRCRVASVCESPCPIACC